MPPTMFMFYFKEPLDTNTLFVCFFPSFLGGMEGVIDHREVISAQERANKPHLFDQVLSSTYVSQRCLWKYTPCLRGQFGQYCLGKAPKNSQSGSNLSAVSLLPLLGNRYPVTLGPTGPTPFLGCNSSFLCLFHLQWCCHSNHCHREEARQCHPLCSKQRVKTNHRKGKLPRFSYTPHPTGIFQEISQVVSSSNRQEQRSISSYLGNMYPIFA